MNRLHRNLIDAVIRVVQSCMYEGKYADRVLEQILRGNPKWGSKDRAFIAESSYEIIRGFRFFSFCSGTDSEPEKIIAAFLVLEGYELPEWELFNNCDPDEIIKRKEQADLEFSICQSYPDELIGILQKELPDNYEKELIALNQKARLVLRVNTLKETRSHIVAQLNQQGRLVEIDDNIPDAIVCMKRWNVFQDPLFKSGCIEIQDGSSQLVGPFCRLRPGMRVIDACAGAGGKTLHMAALLNNTGKILALDIEEWKLNELKKRAKRAGIHCVETRLIENNKVIKRLEASCDRLLLDVPCSGLGVLKRNPDAKWKIDNAFIERMIITQRDILSRYSKMLKVGGKLIYSTCSILPSENSNQIAYFCNENSHFQLEEELSISPADSPYDGFYMARLCKI